MGKGDKKTKRGKIFSGSHGKARPKPQTLNKFEKESGKENKEGKDNKDNKNKKEDK